MARNHKRQAKEAARIEGDKVKLDRRYGKIGISAVAAAIQPHDSRSGNENDRGSVSARGAMEAKVTRAKGKDKRRSHQNEAPNLGQKDAQQDTKSQSELAHMERGQSRDRNQGDD